MSTEPMPPAETDSLHGAAYMGRHELKRCSSCAMSVLLPDQEDLDAVRSGEPLGNVFNQGRACQCVGGHQLHRCGTCHTFKVIRADASEADPRAHRVPLDGYVWVVTAVGFLLLFLRMQDPPTWVWSTALWSIVALTLILVLRVVRRNRELARRREDARYLEIEQ